MATINEFDVAERELDNLVGELSHFLYSPLVSILCMLFFKSISKTSSSSRCSRCRSVDFFFYLRPRPLVNLVFAAIFQCVMLGAQYIQATESLNVIKDTQPIVRYAATTRQDCSTSMTVQLFCSPRKQVSRNDITLPNLYPTFTQPLLNLYPTFTQPSDVGHLATM